MPTLDEAKELAAKWGPAFTSYGLGEKDISSWADLFADRCEIVMPGDHQQAGLRGTKLVLMKSPGEAPEGFAGATFEDMQAKMVEQLSSVDYAKTEGASKGVQEDDMILEYTRTNKSGEVYHVGYVLVTFNGDNLISAMKVFS